MTEHALADAISRARTLTDPDGHPFVADGGAAAVIDVTDGSVVALASAPSYDPGLWVGGISPRTTPASPTRTPASRCCPARSRGRTRPRRRSRRSRPPPRSSTGTARVRTTAAGADDRRPHVPQLRVAGVRPDLAVPRARGLLRHGVLPDRLRHVARRRRSEPRCRAAGPDHHDGARVRPRPSHRRRSSRRSPRAASPTGRGGRRTGRPPATRRVPARRAATRRSRRLIRPAPRTCTRSPRENCADGWRLRAGDAVNMAIGQGDTMVTPLQMLVAYAAIANGGTLWEPQVGHAIVDPSGELVRAIQPQEVGRLPLAASTTAFLRAALQGVARVRHRRRSVRRLPARPHRDRRRRPGRARCSGSRRRRGSSRSATATPW